MRTSNEIRQAFLDYFRKQGHEVVASGPIVPPNDPSLMFANAGMVQFKDVFPGREVRPYKRATTSQKCIRISGKHNDLEAVGPSPRHHTFFEMLGNFSFGDYFKEEAIVFAWELLTKELGLDTSRLIVTYFKGEDGIPLDETARDLWKKITGWGDDRVIGMGKADNFWQMGETGPCGPSSEIYWYHGPNPRFEAFGEEQTPEGAGWMEIWNLVFMQFERSLVDGAYRLEPLPAPSIDTGMGLERITGVVQGRMNNYDTDLLRALVDRGAQHARKPYGQTDSPDDTSLRVIADHARTTAFMIAAGILPGNNGREYVLRRVMRRAIRHGHRLGIEKPFLFDVALAVGEVMGDQYSELRERADLIASVAEQEEVRFRETIDRGLKLLDERVADMTAKGGSTLDGRAAFELYDTYGFPLDLTEVIGRERGFAVDGDGFQSALEEARERSKGSRVNDEAGVDGAHRAALALVPNGAVRFSGYDKDEDSGVVVALIRGGALVESVSVGDSVEVVVDKTPFYGEAGGQLGDSGVVTADGVRLRVSDAQKPLTGLTVHQAVVEDGTLAVGASVRLTIDVERREATRRNHSATHLLHWALRQVLGAHAQQKGSVVGPERLRFDFTHNAPVTDEQLGRIEDLVNERLRLAVPVTTEVVGIEQAKQRGAMMIFEEKYGNEVRLLSMAESMELCGGTHARSTGEIGFFKIVTETGIAAGVRRIIAVTGAGALAHVRELQSQLDAAAKAAKSAPEELPERIAKLHARERELEKQIAELQRKLLTGGGGGMDALLAKARDIGGVKTLAVRTEVTDRGALRELAEQLRDKLGDSVVLVGSVADGKAQLVLTVAKQLTGRLKAGDLIRPVAAKVGGSGGGRPDMAQAGGTEPAALDEALEALYAAVAG